MENMKMAEMMEGMSDKESMAEDKKEMQGTMRHHADMLNEKTGSKKKKIRSIADLRAAAKEMQAKRKA